MESFLLIILLITKKVNCKDVVDYCKQEADKIKPRVWLLFAQKDENFECLQVAHSKNDVKTEVSEAISYIFDHSVFNGDCSNSQFYENVCPNQMIKRNIALTFIEK